MSSAYVGVHSPLDTLLPFAVPSPCMDKYLEAVIQFIQRAIREVDVTFSVQGFWPGMAALLKYVIPPLIVLLVIATSIRALRRRVSRRHRLKRARTAVVVADPAETYTGSLGEQVRRLAEELASQPRNPDLTRLPDGRLEISREGPGGIAHQVFDLLLEEAKAVRATEIHFRRTRTSTLVQFRLAGLLVDRHEFARYMHPTFIALAQGRALLPLDKASNANGHFMAFVDSRERRVNVVILPDGDERELILRFVPTLFPATRLIELGLTDSQVGTWGDLLLQSRGLILVTGPRHSGKTTLAYASMSNIHGGRREVRTLEAHPLTNLPGIRQHVLGLHGFERREEDFRSVIARDIEAVLVDGALPDSGLRLLADECAPKRLTLHVTETSRPGMLLHHLANCGVDRELLARHTLGIADCRLVRRLCPECRTPAKPSRAEAKIFEGHIDRTEGEFFRGRGCANCEGTGYKGLSGLFAVVPAPGEIRELLQSETSRMRFEDVWEGRGTRQLAREGVARAARGETTLEDIVRVLSRAEDADRRDEAEPA